MISASSARPPPSSAAGAAAASPQTCATRPAPATARRRKSSIEQLPRSACDGGAQCRRHDANRGEASVSRRELRARPVRSSFPLRDARRALRSSLPELGVRECSRLLDRGPRRSHRRPGGSTGLEAIGPSTRGHRGRRQVHASLNGMETGPKRCSPGATCNRGGDGRGRDGDGQEEGGGLMPLTCRRDLGRIPQRPCFSLARMNLNRPSPPSRPSLPTRLRRERRGTRRRLETVCPCAAWDLCAIYPRNGKHHACFALLSAACCAAHAPSRASRSTPMIAMVEPPTPDAVSGLRK